MAGAQPAVPAGPPEKQVPPVGPRALLDLATQPLPRPMKYPRFLTGGHFLTLKERVQYLKALSYGINCLSRSPRLILPVPLPSPDDPQVMVIDLADYRIPPEAWDLLLEKGSGRVPLPEPYFNLSLVQDHHTPEKEEWVTEGGYKVLRKVPGSSVKKRVLASAPWVAGGKLDELVRVVGTPYPIARVDWFLANALSAPAYYRFLGLDPEKGTENDLKILARLDEKKSEDAVLKGITDTKIVALNNRILVRHPTLSHRFGGYWWESQDSDSGVGDEDYLKQLLQPRIKAKEIIFTLPNGLQGYGLSNAEGKLQDVAPIGIARDKRTKFSDPQVWNGFKCMICHEKGILDIEDEVRLTARDKVAVFFQSNVKDQKVVERFIDAFSFPLEDAVQRDGLIYEGSVKAVTGLTAPENAKLLEEVLVKYMDYSLTLEGAAAEFGFTGEELRKKLERALGLHHSAVRLMQGSRRVWRVAWEEAGYSTTALYVFGGK